MAEALTASRTNLLAFLEGYQIPADFTIPGCEITVPFLQKWGQFIVGWQIRENPASQEPVQDWTVELVTAFLVAVFDNSSDDDSWSIDHGPPEPIPWMAQVSPEIPCGKLVRKPSVGSSDDGD